MSIFIFWKRCIAAIPTHTHSQRIQIQTSVLVELFGISFIDSLYEHQQRLANYRKNIKKQHATCELDFLLLCPICYYYDIYESARWYIWPGDLPLNHFLYCPFAQFKNYLSGKFNLNFFFFCYFWAERETYCNHSIVVLKIQLPFWPRALSLFKLPTWTDKSFSCFETLELMFVYAFENCFDIW